MKKNIGIKDRRVRLVTGVIIILLGIYFQSWWGILGFTFLITGILNICPLYTILGISTCPTTEIPKEDQKKEIPPPAGT